MSQLPLQNQTDFNHPTSGIYSTGSGDVNLFIANLGEAMSVLKRLIPQEKTSALEQLVKALEQLSNYQRQVNEFKQIHNLLHQLENNLSMVEVVVKYGQQALPIQVIDFNWYKTVKPTILILEDFASNKMSFLNEPRFIISEEKITGPFWVTNIYQLRADFELILKDNTSRLRLEPEPVLQVKVSSRLYDLLLELLNVCRENLYRVDQELLRSIDRLEQFSSGILRIIYG